MMEKFAIVIHGGAEFKTKEEIGPEEAAYRKGLEEAIMAGWNILNVGGSALDAVEAAVRTMEDNPLFNAGKGGALSSKGTNECDASIMCGKTLNAGAVCTLKHIKNPVSLARKILDNSKHVFMSGSGAEDYAREQGLEFKEPSYFKTAKQEKELEATIKEETEPVKDTVGAVALDKHGNLAAAVSTGGLVNRHPARVSDSAIIGAGAFADNDVCAISCTGDGESVIRGLVGHEIYALVKYEKVSLKEACERARQINKRRIEGDINLIAISPAGEIEMNFETKLMFRGYKQGNEHHRVMVWSDEEESKLY